MSPLMPTLKRRSNGTSPNKQDWDNLIVVIAVLDTARDPAEWQYRSK
jgi:hypothetical protein